MSELESQLQRSGLQIVGCCEQLSTRGAALLAHCPLLEDMSSEEADTLGAAMLRVRAAPGQPMIREGESGDWMMLILQGTVDVTWPIPGGGSPDMGNVSEDGKQLWLSGRFDNAVYVFDTTTGAVKIIPVGKEPHGLTVWPQPGRYSLGHTGNMR